MFRCVILYFLANIYSLTSQIHQSDYMTLLQGLEGAVPDFELAIFRGLFLVLISSGYFLVKREKPNISERRKWKWICGMFIGFNGYLLLSYIAIRFVRI